MLELYLCGVRAQSSFMVLFGAYQAPLCDRLHAYRACPFLSTLETYGLLP